MIVKFYLVILRVDAKTLLTHLSNFSKSQPFFFKARQPNLDNMPMYGNYENAQKKSRKVPQGP